MDRRCIFDSRIAAVCTIEMLGVRAAEGFVLSQYFGGSFRVFCGRVRRFRNDHRLVRGSGGPYLRGDPLGEEQQCQEKR